MLGLINIDFTNFINIIAILVNMLMLITVIIGGVFGLIQWIHSNRIKKSEFVNQITKTLRSDINMAAISYKIEYRKFEYNKEFHSDYKLQYKVDMLLSYLSYICYLFKNGIINNDEFNIFKYNVNWICKDGDNIQPYLWNLYHFSKKNGFICSFYCLIDFGIENKLFDDDFEKETCEKYKDKRYLF